MFTDVNQWYYIRKDIADYQDVLYLLYEDHPGAEYAHFQPVMSGNGRLGTSYICMKCEKGYKSEVMPTTNAMGTIVQPAKETKGNVLITLQTKRRKQDCRSCQCRFSGPSCLEAHSTIQGKAKKSVCGRRMRCLSCFSDSQVNPKQAHKCEHLTCRSCKQYVHKSHLCFMQPISYDDLKQAKEENPNTVDTVESGELTDLQEVLASGEKKKPAPCFVHFDIETQGVSNDTVIKPWTLIFVSSNEKTNYVKHKGHDCCRKFIGDLNRLTKTADGKDRDVIAFAHNGQGFDFTFI